MNFKELQYRLQNATNTKVSLTEIGNALGIKLSTVSTRAKNNSELKYSEIKTIENYFNIQLLNEPKEINEKTISYKHEHVQSMIKKLGIGMESYGLYHALMDMLAEKEILSPYITAIFPTLAFIVAIYIFYKIKDL
mgnify:CR=1 FL=1